MKTRLLLLSTFILLSTAQIYALDYLVEQYKKEIEKIDFSPLKKIMERTNENGHTEYHDLNSSNFHTYDEACDIYFDSKMNIRKYISESKSRRIVCYYNANGDLFYITGKDTSFDEKESGTTENSEAGEIYVDVVNDQAVCLDITASSFVNGIGRTIRSTCLSCKLPETFETINIASIITTKALMQDRDITLTDFDMKPDVKFDTNIEGHIIFVTDNRAELRTKADNNCKVIKTLLAGDKVEVIQRQKKSKKDKYHWYKIVYRYGNNQRTEAFIYGEYLDKAERIL